MLIFLCYFFSLQTDCLMSLIPQRANQRRRTRSICKKAILSRIWPVKFENQELDAKRKQMLSRELRDSSSRAVKNFKFSRQKTKKNTCAGGTHAPIFFIAFVGKFCWNELSFPRRQNWRPKYACANFVFPIFYTRCSFVLSSLLINKSINYSFLVF